MVKWPQVNNYPYWFYRQVSLTAGAAEISSAFRVADFASHWVLQKAFVQWPAIGAAAPTTFSNVTVTLQDLARAETGKPENQALPFMVFATPGIFENFATTRATNQVVYESKSLNRIFFASSAFSVTFDGFQALGSTFNFDLLLVGTNVLDHEL